MIEINTASILVLARVADVSSQLWEQKAMEAEGLAPSWPVPWISQD